MSAGHIRRFPPCAVMPSSSPIGPFHQSSPNMARHCHPSSPPVGLLRRSPPSARSVGRRRRPSPSAISAHHTRRLPPLPGPSSLRVPSWPSSQEPPGAVEPHAPEAAVSPHRRPPPSTPATTAKQACVLAREPLPLLAEATDAALPSTGYTGTCPDRPRLVALVPRSPLPRTSRLLPCLPCRPSSLPSLS